MSREWAWGAPGGGYRGYQGWRGQEQMVERVLGYAGGVGNGDEGHWRS